MDKYTNKKCHYARGQNGDDPKEFIPFCGLIGIGSIASICSSYFEEGLLILKNAAKDRKWRIREAVAMGIQRIILKNPQKALNILEKWIIENEYYIWRAVVAGLAEPIILKNKKVAKKA